MQAADSIETFEHVLKREKGLAPEQQTTFILRVPRGRTRHRLRDALRAVRLAAQGENELLYDALQAGLHDVRPALKNRAGKDVPVLRSGDGTVTEGYLARIDDEAVLELGLQVLARIRPEPELPARNDTRPVESAREGARTLQ